MSSLKAPHVPQAILIALCIGAVLILAPYFTWLVLAVWIGDLGRRMVKPLTRLTGRPQRAAALLTAALLTIIVVPIGLVALTLVTDAIELAKRLSESQEVRAMFEKLVTEGGSAGGGGGGGGGGGEAEANPLKMVMAHGNRAWSILTMAFSVAAQVILGLFVFISGVYVVLADGPKGYRWFVDHLPIETPVIHRFANAFTETGHGLFIGVGGAGLAQAIVATIAYVVIGVPEPFVLGLLTLATSVVPSVGTAFVWVPVSIGLALTGRTDAAIGMSIVGVVVIGSIDNIVRPMLARWGELSLPSYLIMIGMFGGLALVGASGLILGPLVLRLAKEALLIAREEREDKKAAESAAESSSESGSESGSGSGSGSGSESGSESESAEPPGSK